MDKTELMRRAIELSRQKMREGIAAPFAALVVKDGEIVGEGWNNVVQDHDATGHGETNAIRDAGKRLGTWDLSGCELYTTCEPCSLCVSAIWWARIDKVYYGNGLDDAEKVGFELAPLLDEVNNPPAGRATPYERLLGEEAFAVFEEWQADSTKAMF